jgi:hypothetical protein
LRKGFLNINLVQTFGANPCYYWIVIIIGTRFGTRFGTNFWFYSDS